MVLFPGLTQLDLTGPHEVFARLPEVDVRLVAESRDAVRSEAGLGLVPDLAFAEAPGFDVLMVPGGPGVNRGMEDALLLDFLRRQAATARYVTSVCTGALLLGAAGLLRGYRATTHWLSMPLLPLFGAEPVAARVVLERNRITGGGITAGIDFGLELAAELRGEDAAREIRLVMEYDPEPPFEGGAPGTARPEVVERVAAARAAFQAERRVIAERAGRALR
jgi:cyclohexyl-isocyanide hydratase